jgi:hypothetical protein
MTGQTILILEILYKSVEGMKSAALTSLYDCLSVLSSFTEFKQYPDLVIKILNIHWATIGNTERRLLPLLECLENCVRSLGA